MGLMISVPRRKSYTPVVTGEMSIGKVERQNFKGQTAQTFRRDQ
jgi:hypothetical protein